MKLDELIQRSTSGEIPAGAMGVVGIVMLFLAMKVAKGALKFMFVLLALALFAGAVWWHFHQRR